MAKPIVYRYPNRNPDEDSNLTAMMFTAVDYVAASQSEYVKELGTRVGLYVPGGLTFSDAQEWSNADATITKMIDEIAKAEGVAGNIYEVLTQGGALMGRLLYATVEGITGGVLGGTSGTVLNPNLKAFYKSPIPRSHDFSFFMIPESSSDCRSISGIVDFFEMNSKPTTPASGIVATVFGKTGQILNYPNLFDIQFVGKSAQYLPQMTLCALKNVSVTYGPQKQFVNYENGFPAFIVLKLSFIESGILLRDNFKNDSWFGGTSIGSLGLEPEQAETAVEAEPEHVRAVSWAQNGGGNWGDTLPTLLPSVGAADVPVERTKPYTSMRRGTGNGDITTDVYYQRNGVRIQ